MVQSGNSSNTITNSRLITLPHSPVHEIEVYTTIGEVPADEWSLCINDTHLFLSREYLKTTEFSSLPGMQFRYAILRNAGIPVSVLYFQMVNLSDTGLGGILNLEEYGGIA